MHTLKGLLVLSGMLFLLNSCIDESEIINTEADNPLIQEAQARNSGARRELSDTD